MGKAENTSENENEEKIENQNEQNKSINMEENDSVKSENLNSIQKESENSQNEEKVQSENLEECKTQNTQNYNFANSQKTLISEATEKVKQNQKSKEKNALENPQKSEKVEIKNKIQDDNSENSGKLQKRKLEKEHEEYKNKLKAQPETPRPQKYLNLNFFPFKKGYVSLKKIKELKEQNCLWKIFNSFEKEPYKTCFPNSVVIKQDKDSKTKSVIVNGLDSVLIVSPDGKETFYACPKGQKKEDFVSLYMGLPIYTDSRSVFEGFLKNAGLTYNVGKISGENKGKELDIYGNPIKEVRKPKSNFLLRGILTSDSSAKKQVYNEDINLYSKWGDHITGKNGNMVELDNGKGKVISNVPYFSQILAQTKDEYIHENGKYKKVSGKNMCQLSVLAMMLSFFGIKGSTDKYFPDELYDDAEELNFSKNKIWDNTDSLYKEILNKFDNSLSLKIIESESEGKEKYKKIIQNQIDKGIPVPTSIHYKIYDKGKEIDANHVIFIVGYTEKGFIVIDPYGNLNKGKNSHLSDDFDGSYVEYAYNKYDICNRHIYLIDKK